MQFKLVSVCILLAVAWPSDAVLEVRRIGGTGHQFVAASPAAVAAVAPAPAAAVANAPFAAGAPGPAPAPAGPSMVVGLSVMITGVDYGKLDADKEVMNGLKKSLDDLIASEVGVPSNAVAIRVLPGSVVVNADIHTDAEGAARVRAAVGSELEAKIVAAVNAIPGIQTAVVAAVSATATYTGESTVPVTLHTKTPNGAYEPGSPLYNKQARRGYTEAENVTWVNITDVGDHVGTWKYEMTHNFWWVIGSAILNILLFSLFAYIYYKFIRVESVQMGTLQTKDRFHHSLFDYHRCCDSDMKICATSWLPCCMPARWADTLSREHVALASFWALVVFFVASDSLSFATAGLTGLVLWGVCVYGRQKLRQVYGLDTGCWTIILDSLVWCCCPCCALAQEARQVDRFAPPVKRRLSN